MSHNSSWLFAIVIKIFPAIEVCLEDKVSKFQTGTMLTSQVMDSQIHAIEKAIRPLLRPLRTDTMEVFLVIEPWNNLPPEVVSAESENRLIDCYPSNLFIVYVILYVKPLIRCNRLYTADCNPSTK